MNNKYLLIIVVVIILILGGVYCLIGQKEPEPVVCTTDVKLCSDGSYVGRVPPDCEFAPCPKENLIQVETPQANETISSPLIVKGKARGFWFFEADFPVKLLDANGNLLAQSIAQTQEEWMTEDFVTFQAEIQFSPPSTSQGILVLEKDNPSGLPEHADELRIPILFSTEGIQKRQVKLFYYNPEKDKDESGNIKCSRDGLVAVEREILISQTPIQDTIRLLLEGKLTETEKTTGITTEYPLEGFKLLGASLKDSVLTLTFEDHLNKTSGGSCRVGILWFQIEATAKQFEEVKQVRFLPEELFQP